MDKLKTSEIIQLFHLTYGLEGIIDTHINAAIFELSQRGEIIRKLFNSQTRSIKSLNIDLIGNEYSMYFDNSDAPYTVFMTRIGFYCITVKYNLYVYSIKIINSVVIANIKQNIETFINKIPIPYLKYERKMLSMHYPIKKGCLDLLTMIQLINKNNCVNEFVLSVHINDDTSKKEVIEVIKYPGLFREIIMSKNIYPLLDKMVEYYASTCNIKKLTMIFKFVEKASCETAKDILAKIQSYLIIHKPV